MCGIAGFYNAQLSENSQQALLKSMHHRGPDDQGVYRTARAGLFHTRLAIIDLTSMASQPFHFLHLTLIFNGEIYNYQEIRETLKKLGYTFESNSDTEVIIKAFHCWEDKCLNHLLGMFAFVIYNQDTNEIFAARDRMGVKPFYFSEQDGQFFFGSELKFFFHFPVNREIDPESVYFYFRFGYVPAHRSIFTSIRKLEPGHFLRVSINGVRLTRYWNPIVKTDKEKSLDEWTEELESLLTSAFQYRMVSDVPVGVFLSGGMDSSILAAILQRSHGHISSFTIGFDESRFDESKHAQLVADHLGLRHTEKKLTVDDARRLFPDFYKIYDEPFADTSGIPVSCVTQLAKENGMKVVLSADGGDELFCGYPHYIRAFRLFNILKKTPGTFRKLIARSTALALPDRFRKEIIPFNFEHKLSAFEELLGSHNSIHFFEEFLANQSNVELKKLIRDCVPLVLSHAVPGEEPIDDMMQWDMRHYLPDDLLVKVDRATMYQSMECREPFLDHRLVEFSMRLPLKYKVQKGKQKYILQALLDRYFPAEFFMRKKQGFSIPVFSWFSNDLDSLFHQYMEGQALKEMPFLNADEVTAEFKKYKYYKKQGKEYNIEKMWRILSFAMWWKVYGR